MIHFPDKTLHRYTYTSTASGVYGETVLSYEYVDDILVDFQNESNQEVAHAYGVDLQNLYKVYTDKDTPLDDTDQLRDNDGNTYHIIGNVQLYTHFHNYKKAHLVLERKENNLTIPEVVVSDGSTDDNT